MDDGVDPEVMRGQIALLKEFLGGCECSDEVIGLALKKCNMDLEGAITMVTIEESVADL